MTKERASADDTAQPKYKIYDHKDLATVRQRIQAFCDWFELPFPELDWEDGDILLNDQFLDWCHEESPSIDWIACGDPRGLAAAYRNKYLHTVPIARNLAKLPQAEQRMFIAGLKAYSEEMLPFEQAMELLKEAITKRRAATATSDAA